MTRRLLLFFVLLASWAHSAWAFEPREIITPQGHRIWFVQEKKIPAVSVELLWRGGVAHDPRGKEGAIELMTALLDEGAGPYDSLAFRTALDDRAIELSFNAGADSIGASLRSLSEHADEAFRLLGMALAQPRFDEDALARLRDQFILRLERTLSSPNGIANRAFTQQVFEGHPYGRVQTTASLRAIGADDLRALHRARLARDNVIIAAVGDIDPDRLARQVDAALASLPVQAASWELPPATWPNASATQVIARRQAQAVMVFGLPGLKRNDPDYYGLQVMNWILGGGGFSSRLVEEVRDERGLAYSVSTGLQPMQAAAMIVGGTASQGEGARQALAIIKAEMARMAQSGVTAQELRAAKSNLIGAFPLRLSSNAQIAAMMASMQYHGLPRDYVDRYDDLIGQVTAAQVQSLARRLLDLDRLQVTLVGAE